MTPQRTDPAADFAALRDDLGEADAHPGTGRARHRGLGGLRPSVAEVVAEGDREIDLRSSALEARILSLHQNWSTFASDLRLLHVGLIAAVALERVGNLAVSIARLAGSAPPPEAGAEAAAADRADGRDRDRRPRACGAGGGRSDLEAGAQAVRDAARLSPMLDQVLAAVAQAPGEPGMRAWSAAAVLVARHVERVANNAAELGARVHFLVTGETAPSTRVTGRALLVAHRAGNDPRSARAAAGRRRPGGGRRPPAARPAGLRHPRRIGPVLWDREGVALVRGAPQGRSRPSAARADRRAAPRPEGRPSAPRGGRWPRPGRRSGTPRDDRVAPLGPARARRRRRR